jgi:hypothetical protein
MLGGKVRFLAKPLEPVIFALLAGGPAAAAAREAWARTSGRPLFRGRLAAVAEEVLAGVETPEEKEPEMSLAQVLPAGAGWLFLALAVAGVV